MTTACKLGNSTFNLSCSDLDMNGPEDCGKIAGDGKARTGYMNDWIFEGMAGATQGFDCTAVPAPQCVVRAGSLAGASINYDYVVTNEGTTTLSNVYLSDNRLGLLAGPFSLDAGETFSFTTQAQLLTTTDNIATVYVNNGSGPECQATSNQVMVTVIPYCPEWAGATTVQDKKVKRSITNPTTVTATITGIAVSWPATNGKLKKIKLDSDVVWDTTSPAGATSITIPASALTSDVNHKSIKADKTRAFTLEFENNASATFSPYTLTLAFGSCTLSAPPWE